MLQASWKMSTVRLHPRAIKNNNYGHVKDVVVVAMFSNTT